MDEVERLVAAVERARRGYLAGVAALSAAQAAFRGAPDAWSIAEVTEHLVHAESGGIRLIWTAADAVRAGRPAWSGESSNRGLQIEQIVERTWRPKEVAPESAVPRSGGPLEYWMAALQSCSVLLNALAPRLADLDLAEVVYPHAISGPLDARQRLEFLRFHLERHCRQVDAIRAQPAFPN